MILQPPGEWPTIYTNIYATSTSLFEKYLLNNSVRQNKEGTPFDPEALPGSTQRISRTDNLSVGVPTPPVERLGSLRHDRLYMNMRSKCLHTNSNVEYGVISSDIQLSKHYAAICICDCSKRSSVLHTSFQSAKHILKRVLMQWSELSSRWL